jgi:tRNA pseudouridine32 synthase/23S rRNA pseudouridine746 synthase
LRVSNSQRQGNFMWENRILFLDGEALVLDKPAGLAVHPGPRTRESLEDHLHQLRFGFQRSPTPVHRLDRDTSGCLLLARNPKAHKRFQQAFEQKGVAKAYVAIIDGVPEAQAGTIDLPLAKSSTARDGWRMIPSASGKTAVTRWRVLGEERGRALILFEPETGRTHQLRVHAAEGLRLPISGDPRYGSGRGPMMLHALSLKVDRPGKAPIEARAPLPDLFRAEGFADVQI